MRVFLYCLSISTLLWVLIVFSKEYTIDVWVKVNYTNFPAGKVVSTALPEKLKLSVKGTGFGLLLNNWRKKTVEVNLDISKARFNSFYNDYGFDVRSTIDSISKHFSKNVHIVKISPESFTFKVKPKIYKLVPVKLNALINYQNQFHLSGNIAIVPLMVRISGDSAELAQVNEIETESVILRNLNKTVLRNVQLKVPSGFKSIQLEQKTILLYIPVEKFTEATVNVPIVVDNVPRGFSIKTFPEEVKVVYRVSISKYDKVDKKLFSVRADFSTLGNEKNKLLKLKVLRTPEYVRNVRIEPEKVEFILKRL